MLLILSSENCFYRFWNAVEKMKYMDRVCAIYLL